MLSGGALYRTAYERLDYSNRAHEIAYLLWYEEARSLFGTFCEWRLGLGLLSWRSVAGGDSGILFRSILRFAFLTDTCVFRGRRGGLRGSDGGFARR